MELKIFAMTHKKFTPPPDHTYIPLQVGRTLHDDLGYLTDATGDNISALNCYYSELSGIYWVWKNEKDAAYVGVCHYRRYLLNEKEELFSSDEILSLLQEYDVITSKKLTLNFSYAYGFQENHTKQDLEAAQVAIAELYPDFSPLFEQRLQEKHTYFGNIMICKKTLFDEYCSFLFPIFEKMEPMLPLDSYDDYHKRLYGFISEFILMVWCEYKELRVKECKVGLVGEKKETTEVIQNLWDMLVALPSYESSDTIWNKIQEAKSYFLSIKKKRPDILMEASDIHGHLHLCLQALSIAEFELSSYSRIMFPLGKNGLELMHFMEELNQCILCIKEKQATKEQLAFIQNSNLSEEALSITTKLYCQNPTDYQNVIAQLQQLRP